MDFTITAYQAYEWSRTWLMLELLQNDTYMKSLNTPAEKCLVQGVCFNAGGKLNFA